MDTLIKFQNDVDRALLVMKNASEWLEQSGKKPNKWWQSKNMNRAFMLKHAEPEEFFVAIVDGKLAASVILQDNERNQSWKSIDRLQKKSAIYVHWLAVVREFSGRNLPKEFVDFAGKQAKRQNLKLLRLDTDANEGKLCKLYENLGFVLMGVEQEGSHKTAFYQKAI